MPHRRLPALAAILTAAILPAAAMGQDSTERAVLDRINFARTHPQDYAEQLRDYRRYFEGRIVYLPGDEGGVITVEGTAAVDDAIAFLERQPALPPLAPGTILALAAQDHADAQARDGTLGHASRAGATPGERVRRRGGDIYVGEGITYGFGDPDTVVRQLIVDDGVRTRGHRAQLFDPRYRFAGVGCGRHPSYRAMCVVDYSATADGRPPAVGR
ncbi:CAP domain-containing protein [Sphingomonas sp. CJ20]